LVQFFVQLSGEHYEAGTAETEALLDLLPYPVKTQWYGRMGVLSSSEDPVPFLLERAVMTQYAGRLLATTTVNDVYTLDIASIDGLTSLGPNRTFAIRTLLVVRWI
jgi:hypothetical protein